MRIDCRRHRAAGGSRHLAAASGDEGTGVLLRQAGTAANMRRRRAGDEAENSLACRRGGESDGLSEQHRSEAAVFFCLDSQLLPVPINVSCNFIMGDAYAVISRNRLQKIL